MRKRHRCTSSCKVVELIDEDAITWAKGLDDRFGKARSERLIHYPKPRGGRVQERIDAELPIECDDADVRAIVTSLAKDMTAIGVPFTIVVHVPDATNDRRNRHCHLIWYPGRCSRLEDGTWQFGGKSGEPAKLRPGEIAVRLSAIDAEGRSRLPFFRAAGADINALRTRFAGHVNVQLEAQARDRGYDPRTYEEMGIDKTPEEHLGTAAAKLVAAGVTVDIDVRNALTSWSAAHRRRELAQCSRAYHHQNIGQRIQRNVNDEALSRGGSHRALDHLLDRYRDAANEVIDGRAELDRFDLAQAEATSAARRLQRGTARLIEADETGRARPDDAKNAHFIRARHRMAEQHLAEIEDVLEPFAEYIEQYRERLVRLERELLEMEVQANELIRVRKAERVRLRDEAILMREGYSDPVPDPHHHEARQVSMTPDTQQEAAKSSSIIRLVQEEDYLLSGGIGSPAHDGMDDHRYADPARSVPDSIAERQAEEVQCLVALIQRHGAAILAEAYQADMGAETKTPRTLYRKYGEHPKVVKALITYEARHGARRRMVTQPPIAAPHVAATSVSPANTFHPIAPIERTTPLSVSESVPSAITPDRRAIIASSPDSHDDPVADGSPSLPIQQSSQETTVLASTAADRGPANAPSVGDQHVVASPSAPKTNPPAPDADVATKITGAARMRARLAAASAALGTQKVTEPEPGSSVGKSVPDMDKIEALSTHPASAAPRGRADLKPLHFFPLSPVIAPVGCGFANEKRSISAAGNSERGRPLCEAPAFHEALALHGASTIRDGQPGDVVKLSDLASPAALTTGIDPRVRDVNLRLDAAPDHDPVADRPAREAQPAPAVDIETIIASLHALQFLPLRRIRGDDGRSHYFRLVVEEAAPDDAAVLRQAAQIDAEQRQRLFSDRWMAMHERLRMMLTTGSRKALSHALISGLRSGDQHTRATLLAEGWDTRLLVALRTAGNDPRIDKEIVSSREYWRGEMHKKLLGKTKNRSAQVVTSEVPPRVDECRDEDAALDVLAQLSKNRGQGR